MNERSFKTIKEELQSAIFDYIYENNLDPFNDEDVDQAREAVTNETYYIIGYWNCEQWLDRHGVSAWEAIEYVKEWEIDNFGMFTRKCDSEKIANMLAYIIAWDVQAKEVA